MARSSRVEKIVSATAAQDQELIVLVDDRGEPTGRAEKWSSHHADTPLHLAFSCYVFDRSGSFLATRRALPDHVYRAPPFQGIVEHEFCPVFVARAAGDPQPNPVEVGASAWMAWPAFVCEARGDAGDVWSWWCKNQLRELDGHPLLERYAAGMAA
jgi:isopentenyl-diphosphate delta-isomerase